MSTAQRGAEKLPNCVISLRCGRGTLPPLFLTPPAAGSPACYAAFAGALEGDRTVYGFEAPGLVGGKPVGCFKAQARQYVAALTTVQPRGPYYIAGWSLGGPVAFEMACQLREAGEEVAYLGLIDATLPVNGRLPGGVSMVKPLWWVVSFLFAGNIPLNYRTFRLLASWVGIGLPESWSDVRRRGLKGGLHFVGGLLASGWRSLRVFHASLRGFRRYQPRPFDGAVTVFQTAQSRDLGKSDRLRNDIREWSRHVEVHDAPGSHMTLLLDPRTASGFAAHFEATLHELAPSSTT